MLNVLVLIAIGLGTYAFRAAFVVTNRKSPPAPLAKALPLVGPAVLAAITVPALLAPGGHLSPGTSLPALAAALVCYLLRRLTNSLPLALFGGLAVGWIAISAVTALS
jgi:branched-subunit amino acid transport protein